MLHNLLKFLLANRCLEEFASISDYLHEITNYESSLKRHLYKGVERQHNNSEINFRFWCYEDLYEKIKHVHPCGNERRF